MRPRATSRGLPGRRLARPRPLVLLLLVPLLLAAAPPGTQDARPRPYTAADFFAHPHSAKSYTETWSYELHLDSGHRLLVSFLKTNLGVFSGVCGVQVWFMGPGTAPVTIGRELPLERYREDREGLRISWKRSYLEGLPPGAHRLHLDVPKGPGIIADINFHDLVPGFVDGDGALGLGRRGSAPLRLMIPIPRARTTGRIRLGARTYDAAGWAYAEHTVQTRRARDVLRRRRQARFIDAERTISISVLETTREYGQRQLGLAFVADSRGVVEVVRAVNLQPELLRRRGDERLATSFQATLRGTRVTAGVAWQETGLLQRFAATAALNRATAWLVRRVAGDPVFYRFANRYAVQLTVDGRTELHTGHGFHSVMIAR